MALPQIVATNSFKVAANRLNKFDDKIDLAVEGLPPGVTAKAAAIEKGKPDATIELSGPIAMAEGDYPFRVTGGGHIPESTPARNDRQPGAARG